MSLPGKLVLNAEQKLTKTIRVLRDFCQHLAATQLQVIIKPLTKDCATILCLYLHTNSINEMYQLGFRPYQSTETVLVRMVNDLLPASNQGCVSLLVLLDLSVAFDATDHSILINRLENVKMLLELKKHPFYFSGQ